MLRERKTGHLRTARLAVGSIVRIDQQPLRARAADDCRELMARLEGAREIWQRFERKDKPAFARWRAREFGALLSRAREVEEQIRDQQSLIHEVEMELRRHIQDPHTAYQRVLYRRAHPEEISQDKPESVRSGDGTARKLSDFEKEALFQEWVQRSLGTNPDKMDDDAYTTSFEAFKTHMFRQAPEEPPAPASRKHRAEQSARAMPHDSTNASESETGEETKIDARVKELYRTLVRRLHPDRRSDGNAAASALWHEVQDAYAASDVGQMEILLAVSQITAGALGDETSLGQMRAVAEELERSLFALEDSLVAAEREEAWDFAHRGPDRDLRTRVEREMKLSLASRLQRLDLLTRTIADWSEGARPNRYVAVPRSRDW